MLVLRKDSLNCVRSTEIDIRMLSHVYSTSRVVAECRTSFNEMVSHFYQELVWVRGHSNSPGNIAEINGNARPLSYITKAGPIYHRFARRKLKILLAVFT